MNTPISLLRSTHPFASALKTSPGLSTSSNASFRYHIPRRLGTPNFHTRSLDAPKTLSCHRYSSSDTTHNDTSVTCQSHGPPQTISRSVRHAVEVPTIGKGFSPRQTQNSATPSIAWSTHRKAFHLSSRVQDTPRKKDRELGKETEHIKSGTTTTTTTTNDDGPSQPEHFYDRLPLPNFHRPTKEELLAAASGFWSRLRVRFKWLTIKSARPYNMDEIVGFFSWIVLGHVVWIIIGTTTFVSLAILAINSIFAQETLARWIGNYLTQSSGLNVVFESAIVPKWKDGVITFKNVFVSRRPGQPANSGVTKGSPEAAAIAAAAQQTPPEDQNYTQFDITLGEVNVTLSFNKWWNSKGLLKNVEIKHVRGVIDRTHVYWSGEPVDPKSYRHEHNPGDFEIESFKIEDLLLTLHQPNGFRPFPVSIYNADLPRLRKQWLFYDFLCANNMTGEFDRSLFTIHPRQTHTFTGLDLQGPESDQSEPWKKQSRIRLDSLNIEHLNRGTDGPFGWITEGNVDIVADILIPNDTDDSVMKVMSDFYDQIERQFLQKKQQFQDLVESNATTVRSADSEPMPQQTLPTPSLVNTAASYSSTRQEEKDRRFLVMDLRVHLNDVRASVPLFTKDLSYVNNALIRPIVAYINSRRTFIPINCRVVKRIPDFDGSWTIYDSGLMNDLSAETYEAFVRDIHDEQARYRRFKKVGLWSLQLAVQAIFLGMAGNMA